MISSGLKSAIFIGAIDGSLVLLAVSGLAMSQAVDSHLGREEVAALAVGAALLAQIGSAWLVARRRLGLVALVLNGALSLGIGMLCLIVGSSSALFAIGGMRSQSPEPRCGMPMMWAMMAG